MTFALKMRQHSQADTGKPAPLARMKGFCMTCAKMVELQDVQKVKKLKNGTTLMAGKCPKCKGKVFRIVA